MRILQNHFLEIELIEHIRELIRKERLTLEILDVLDFNFRWLLQFCQKNDIVIPDRARLQMSWNRLRKAIRELDSTTQSATPETNTR